MYRRPIGFASAGPAHGEGSWIGGLTRMSKVEQGKGTIGFGRQLSKSLLNRSQ